MNREGNVVAREHSLAGIEAPSTPAWRGACAFVGADGARWYAWVTYAPTRDGARLAPTWLTFAASHERRRLSPIPAEWHSASGEGLDDLRRAAVVEPSSL